MSKFAFDQLFMHGHFVSPAALMAAGLLPGPTAALPPRPAAEPATASSRPKPAPVSRGGRLAHT